MGLSKSKRKRFSAEEVINYIPRTKKSKKVLKREMIKSSGFLSSSMIPILSWKLKMISYRGSSTIHPSSKLELFGQ